MRRDCTFRSVPTGLRLAAGAAFAVFCLGLQARAAPPGAGGGTLTPIRLPGEATVVKLPQACCDFDSVERTCFDDDPVEGTECLNGTPLGEGTTCAADCPCASTCLECVGKSTGDLTSVQIRLVSSTFDGTNTTFVYRICQESGPALKYWVLGLSSPCCEEVVGTGGAGSSSGVCEFEPATEMTGLIFKDLDAPPSCGDPGTCAATGYEFSVTLRGDVPVGCVKVANKGDTHGESTSTACVQGPVCCTCDDGNVCTTDACLPDGSCVNTPRCTADVDCDDGDRCTTDTCLPSGCCENTVHCTLDAQCDDGNACTTDRCLPTGCCEKIADCTIDADCDDGNACTTDLCANGCCEYFSECTVDAHCNDNIPCTVDRCVDGCCRRTQACTQDSECNDGNTCTTDRCVSGCCTNTPGCTQDGQCNDGNACTTDRCVGGCCTSTPGCTQDGQCNDGNACTTDRCVGGCCTSTPGCTQNSQCDDSNACTVDRCVGGCCENVSGCTQNSQCNDNNTCTTDVCSSGCCINTPGCTQDVQCNDGNACTVDQCLEGCCESTPGCTFDGQCNDNNTCTADRCLPGGCCEYTVIVGCGGGNLGACCLKDEFDTCRNDMTFGQCPNAAQKFFPGRRCSQIDCASVPIATLSEWGMVMLTLLLLVAAKVRFGHGPAAVESRA